MLFWEIPAKERTLKFEQALKNVQALGLKAFPERLFKLMQRHKSSRRQGVHIQPEGLTLRQADELPGVEPTEEGAHLLGPDFVQLLVQFIGQVIGPAEAFGEGCLGKAVVKRSAARER